MLNKKTVPINTKRPRFFSSGNGTAATHFTFLFVPQYSSSLVLRVVCDQTLPFYYVDSAYILPSCYA